MPEEVNRVLADHVADLAFAPTETAVDNLKREGIRNGIHLVGNPVVDACLEHLPIAREQSDILKRLNLTEDQFVVVTIHRQRNTRDIDRLKTIVQALSRQELPVVFPIHPRTREAMEAHNLSVASNVKLVKPMDYLDFLKLLSSCRFVITDSGGIQEEASILEVPCLTVRPNTERPETVDAGVNRLVEPSSLQEATSSFYDDPTILDAMTGAPNLYGDGEAAERISDIFKSELS